MKSFLKSKNLNRSELKQISGGIKIPLTCYTLCGEAGGVESGHPGVGDVCTSDGSFCCYCR
ncbi:hypothetical protein [Chryseobacterium sp. Bi04]|uniref:hypothetical protein n=1 Tax=Chryseobacterium sp. Bi04 TaxID=2822345 RepID=UPI001DFA6A07|nr:hypothetical protein [Chryseobacterium sp. Bi04]CAH0162232.1 hypothetical protein SRABI04_01041 [Chryseobacterium sp. Bi04]